MTKKRTEAQLVHDVLYIDQITEDGKVPWSDDMFVYVVDTVTGICWTANHRFDVIEYLAA